MFGRRTAGSLALLIPLSACALWFSRPPSPAGLSAASVTIFVDARGYHTDIGLRVADLTGPLARVAHDFPGARSLLIGFGDRTFVTTRNKWLGTWLLTLLPGKGAMLVTGLAGDPDVAFDPRHVAKLHVTHAQFAAIEDFIGDSFVQANGDPRFIGHGPYAGSRFYASTRTYDLLDTCNTWTAAALGSGGLPEPVPFTLFASQTMGGARRLQSEGY
jgi:uncharacterized protein (TIGR02117 family)